MTTSAPASPRPFVIVCLVLVLATLAVYWPVTRHEFVHYDDDQYLLDNSHVNTGLSWTNIVWAFENKHAGNWHPLTWMAHMADCQMFGLKPAGHHLVNVLFHTMNSLLLFVFLTRTTGAFWRSALVAAFFAWHPLRVESVAWAAELKDVLSAFFWMLTLLCYAKAVTSDRCQVTRPEMPPPGFVPRVTCHMSPFYWLALFFFACGLLSKPMVVTLPFVLLLLDFWPLNRFAVKSAGQLVIEKILFFVLAAAVSVVTFLVQESSGAFWTLENLPLSARIANALVAYVGYIFKTFWPANLALIYPHPHHWPAVCVAGSTLFLPVLTALILLRAKKQPYLLTGWFWFLGTLVPVIGLVQVGIQSMADRYTYLPGIGLAIAVVWGANELFEQPKSKQLLALAGGFALVACLAVTSIQINYWQNDLKLFSRAVAVTTDNYAAEVCLGEALERAGHTDDALAVYADAVRVEPDYPIAQFKLAMMLLAANKPDDALVHLNAAAQLMPHNSDVQYDLGIFLSQHGRPREAIEHFRAALRERPDFPAAKRELAALLAAHPELR